MITLDQLSRVAIVGTSCSGKTTLATSLADVLAVPRIELDAHYWGPNWTPRPTETFRESVDRATAASRWVCDGNYRVVRDLVWQRATAVVWLDYTFPLVFRRALRRTLSRCTSGARLYSDNRETFRKAFLSGDSILLWVCQSYWRNRRKIPDDFRQPEHGNLHVVRLTSPGATSRFLGQVGKIAAGNGQ